MKRKISKGISIVSWYISTISLCLMWWCAFINAFDILIGYFIMFTIYLWLDIHYDWRVEDYLRRR